jgi:hypothetical protein
MSRVLIHELEGTHTTTQQSDQLAVLGRLERLERHNRWMGACLAPVFVLAGAVVLMAGQPQAKTGKPEKIVLRDDKGKERAWLGMANAGPVLRFRDESGKERLWLGLAKNTPGLVLYDEQGKRLWRRRVAMRPWPRLTGWRLRSPWNEQKPGVASNRNNRSSCGYSLQAPTRTGAESKGDWS